MSVNAHESNRRGDRWPLLNGRTPNRMLRWRRIGIWIMLSNASCSALTSSGLKLEDSSTSTMMSKLSFRSSADAEFRPKNTLVHAIRKALVAPYLANLRIPKIAPWLFLDKNYTLPWNNASNTKNWDSMGECENCSEALCPGTCQPEPGTALVLIGLGSLALLLLLLLIAKLFI